MSDFKIYGQSKKGNFKPIDTIGVPHPYCIGPKLVTFTADHHNGMLGEYAIEDAEKNGIHCDICRQKNNREFTPILSYKEHQQALLISCKKDMKNNKELKDYLFEIKDLAEKNNLVGFAFKKDF